MWVAFSSGVYLKKNERTNFLDQLHAKVNKKLVKSERKTPSTIRLFYNLMGSIAVILVVPSISVSITVGFDDSGNKDDGSIIKLLVWNESQWICFKMCNFWIH